EPDYEVSLPPKGAAKKKAQRGIRPKSPTGSAMWLIASALMCLVALLSKETAVILPMILFALMLVAPFGQPSEGAGKDPSPTLTARLIPALRQSLPFFSVIAVYLFLRFNALGGRLGALNQHLPLHTVLLSWPATLWFYVKVLMWPVQLRAFADSTQADAFSVR